MPIRHHKFTSGNYYHIFNRGAGKNLIFFNSENYEYCLRLVTHYSRIYSIELLAYCLMPNHYHFCLRQCTDISISKFISVLFNAYTQAVNKQLNRQGTLFEGRFKHVWIEQEEYLIHLCRYIHLNPVKARLAAKPEDWLYSNYLDWIGKRNGTLADKAFINYYFPKTDDYRQFVADQQVELEAQERIAKYILDWDQVTSRRFENLREVENSITKVYKQDQPRCGP